MPFALPFAGKRQWFLVVELALELPLELELAMKASVPPFATIWLEEAMLEGAAAVQHLKAGLAKARLVVLLVVG